MVGRLKWLRVPCAYSRGLLSGGSVDYVTNPIQYPEGTARRAAAPKGDLRLGCWLILTASRTLAVMETLFPAMLGLPPLVGLTLGFAKRWDFLWIGVLGAILVAFAWLTVEGGDPANVYFTDWHDWMLLAAAWLLLSFCGGYVLGRVLRLIHDAGPDHSG